MKTPPNPGCRNELLLIDMNNTSPCPHFPACGGCTAQNMDAAAYRAWKENIIYGALHRHGIKAKLDEFISCAPKSRRRVVLAFTREKNKIPAPPLRGSRRKRP